MSNSETETVTVDRDELEAIVDERVDQRLEQQGNQQRTFGRRSFLASAAAAAGLGAMGHSWIQEASAQTSAVGQIGTDSERLDVYANNLYANDAIYDQISADDNLDITSLNVSNGITSGSIDTEELNAVDISNEPVNTALAIGSSGSDLTTIRAAKDPVLTGGTSTFDAWIQGSPTRPVVYYAQIFLSTDGSSDARVGLEADFSGENGPSDTDIDIEAPSGAGAHSVNKLAQIIVPAGGQYRITNKQDPNGSNNIVEGNEIKF